MARTHIKRENARFGPGTYCGLIARRGMSFDDFIGADVKDDIPTDACVSCVDNARADLIMKAEFAAMRGC